MASGGQVRYPQFQAPLIRGFNLTIFCKWTIFPSKVQSLQSPYSMCPLVICYSLLLKMAHRNSWFSQLQNGGSFHSFLLTFTRGYIWTPKWKVHDRIVPIERDSGDLHGKRCNRSWAGFLYVALARLFRPVVTFVVTLMAISSMSTGRKRAKDKSYT